MTRTSRWPAVICGIVLLYLGTVLLIPLGAIVVKAAPSDLRLIIRGITSPDAVHGLLLSFALVLIAGIVNATFGIAGGIVLARHRFFGRRALDTLVDMPLALSPVMVGYAFLVLFGRGGWFAPAIEHAGIRVVFAFPGLVIATLLVTLPFTVREVSALLTEIGTGDEEAAATLGASAWQTFHTVTLPNVRHALAFGITLACARALGEFGAVLVIGGAISGKTQTATTFIYAALEERQEAAAYGMALLLAAASVALLALLQWIKHRRVA